MRILFASAEVYPFSKTGGLADVAGALPKALVAAGHEVLVVSPWYRTLHADPAPLWIGDVAVPFDGAFEPVGVGTLEVDGVRFAFVGHASFQRDALYGHADDAYRFARFTRAIAPVAHRVGFMPDVAHAHDWHAAYLPLILRHGWHLPDGWPGLPSVYTIHNLQHQGVSPLEATVHWLRLPRSVLETGMQHFGSANAMQAGLDLATRVTTVSPTYAEEIQRPEFGFGLDGTLRHVSWKLRGILNGIDETVWNPATDPWLPAPFDAGDLSGKVAARTALLEELGLRDGGPVLAAVSRFAEQKGIDLLLDAADDLVGEGWRLALLGSGDAALEASAMALAARHPGQVAVRLGYDEPLAHRIYAGADAFAIPSRFEPCGLTQMIAMRYGTIPIARATGGLADTIRPGVTGFLFADAHPGALQAAAREAKASFDDDEVLGMRQAGMRASFDWSKSAEAYVQVYRDAVAG